MPAVADPTGLTDLADQEGASLQTVAHALGLLFALELRSNVPAPAGAELHPLPLQHLAVHLVLPSAALPAIAEPLFA
jgi:hypothetical protein